MRFKLVLILVFSILASFVRSQQQVKCDASGTLPLKVTVNSRRNQTGHWISQVELDHRAALDQRSTTVDVEHSTVPCVGMESGINIILTFTAHTTKFGADFELFPGLGYYKLHTNVATWPHARQTCAEEGAHLVVINSEKESEVIKTLLARFPTITGASHQEWAAWIGIRRIGDDFVTVLGDSLNNTGFTRWHPGQPNKGDEYGLVHRTSGGMGDVTVSAGWKLAFICEREF